MKEFEPFMDNEDGLFKTFVGSPFNQMIALFNRILHSLSDWAS